MDGGLVNALTGIMELDNTFLYNYCLQLGSYATITQEVLYISTFTDIEVRPLNGTISYVIHFIQTRSISNSLLVFSIYNEVNIRRQSNKSLRNKDYTEGLKNNTDDH
jgi:hypothetical protein